MSTSNRIGRNPFDKANKAPQAVIAEKALEAKKTEKVLKISDKKIAASTQTAQNEASATFMKEEQIIGELIDLPEENWQPLTMVPAQFIKQVFSRWI